MYELAQVNVARFKFPPEDPRLAGFMEALDPVNALADDAPGFVWRLQDDSGNATSIHAFDDPLLLINLSVWQDIDALHDFVYRTQHAAVMRRRAEWADRMEEAYLVLWWVPAGHRPDLAEARERLEHLRTHGPTPTAFTFRDRFDPPEAATA